MTAPDVRERLHEAVLVCASRSALRFSVEDVAQEAGCSRATVYRYFPGGKDQLITEGVAWEVGRFFTRIHAAVQHEPDLASQLERALVEGHQLLAEHGVLQRIMRDDPEQFLATLETPMLAVRTGLEVYVASLLRREDLAPGVDVDEAAEYIARLYLGYLGHAGQVDLDDPAQLRHLVRTQFVGGILAAEA
jgi:AcrR family transcriptional regulator